MIQNETHMCKLTLFFFKLSECSQNFNRQLFHGSGFEGLRSLASALNTDKEPFSYGFYSHPNLTFATDLFRLLEMSGPIKLSCSLSAVCWFIFGQLSARTRKMHNKATEVT